MKGGRHAAKAQRRLSAQPLAGTRQQLHIVADPLGNGLSFQLGEDGRNIEHGFAHRRGGIELLPDTDKADLAAVERFDEGCKIRHAAADPIQPIAYQHIHPPGLHRLHQRGKLRTVQRSTGKALILIDLYLRLRPMLLDILSAQRRLVFNGIPRLTLYRFSAVNRSTHRIASLGLAYASHAADNAYTA